MKSQKKQLHKGGADLAPPWRTREAWREANHSIARHINLHRDRLKGLEDVALDIRRRMVHIFSVLDELCNNSCPWCPTPCCLSALVWFDFSDLLSLHLSDQEIPPEQPKSDLKGICRYLGPEGCRLPRFHRPWICTWYLCDTQMAYLRKKDVETRTQFEKTMDVVKTKRKVLEAEFIRIVIS